MGHRGSPGSRNDLSVSNFPKVHGTRLARRRLDVKWRRSRLLTNVLIGAANANRLLHGTAEFSFEAAIFDQIALGISELFSNCRIGRCFSRRELLECLFVNIDFSETCSRLKQAQTSKGPYIFCTSVFCNCSHITLYPNDEFCLPNPKPKIMIQSTQ